MENRRKEGHSFEFFLLAVLLALFVSILLALVFEHEAPEVITLVGGWGGTVLAMIGMIVSFQFGSSKGSQLKDQAMSRAPDPTDTTTSTISTTMSNTPPAEPVK